MQEIVLYICSKEHKKSNIKSQSVYVRMYRFHSIGLSSNKASKTSGEDNHIFRPIIYYLGGNNSFKTLEKRGETAF